MRRGLPLTALILIICPAFAKGGELPWQVNPPIAKVTKTLWFQHPSDGVAIGARMNYVGPNLELMEYSWHVSTFDQLYGMTTRLSTDNGKTWSDFQVTDPSTNIVYYAGDGGVNAVEVKGCDTYLYDTQAGVLVDTWLRVVGTSQTSYWRLSQDNGSTWSTPQMLRYEAGDEFNPSHPKSSNYLTHNLGYFGNSIIKLSNGNILTPLGQTKSDDGSIMSSLCMIGTWNASNNDYQWTAGSPVTISPTLSSVGLVEPDAAELKDKRVLVTWRGEPQARKYFSVSTDGGMTLSSPAELKYDDGTSFYSSASYHRLIRNSMTGKLYWIGNISANDVPGTWPRYPLVIAEVDESGTPSLKKNTVTVIDDKQLGQTDSVQFSNFNVFEDRETHAFNLYLTAYGESGDSSTTFYNANCYKYVVTVPEPTPLTDASE